MAGKGGDSKSITASFNPREGAASPHAAVQKSAAAAAEAVQALLQIRGTRREDSL